MTCGNCEKTVRNALTALPCVEEVHSVSFQKRRVECTIADADDRDKVVDEIESLGFLVKDSQLVLNTNVLKSNGASAGEMGGANSRVKVGVAI